MVAIWLWLLGIASMVTGSFTRPEAALTIIIDVSCGIGIAGAIRASSPTRKLTSWTVFLLFALAQIAAMWLSLRPILTDR